MSNAINRIKDGVFTPQVQYPVLTSSLITWFQIVGSDENSLYCISNEFDLQDSWYNTGSWVGPILTPVLKPFMLANFNYSDPSTKNYYATNPLYIYSNASPPVTPTGTAPKYTVTYSTNWSNDGNARLATRSDGVVEVQVLSRAYQYGQLISAISLPFGTSALASGAFNFMVVTPTAETVVSGPSYLENTTSSYLDMNVDARHWVSQPPQISSISPSSGSTSGGTEVTITGGPFQTGASVLCGTAGSATSVTVSGTTSLTCYTPFTTTTGAVSVSVINPSGSFATKANGYTYT